MKDFIYTVLRRSKYTFSRPRKMCIVREVHVSIASARIGLYTFVENDRTFLQSDTLFYVKLKYFL